MRKRPRADDERDPRAGGGCLDPGHTISRYGPPHGLPQGGAGLDPATRGRVFGDLQRRYGNRAVQRLVAEGPPAVQRAELYHDAHPVLDWQDFQGEVPKGSPHDAAVRWARTGLDITWRAERKSGKWEAEAKIKAASLNLRAYMDSQQSWVRKDKQQPTLLSHEQGHFDIAHTLVEKAEPLIGSAAAGAVGKGRAASAAAAGSRAVADLQKTEPFVTLAVADAVINRAQADYDGPPPVGTGHGTDAAGQQRWEKEIAADLPAYPIK